MTDKKNILITGANGQLGQELQVSSRIYNDYNFYFTGKENLSITDGDEIENFLLTNNITSCINCAAYTAVDKAEADLKAAFAINSTAPAQLAVACKKYGVRLIHISTDYVFDGSNTRPYKEDDITNSLSVYGASKLQGEKRLLENHHEAIVIRTSWLYSTYGSNFVKTMLRLLQSKESISVVSDQFGSPTYAADLARAILKIIAENQIFTGGIYHYCNEGVISWHEFASAIKNFINSKCIIKPVTSAEYPVTAKRPAYSALDTTKIQQAFDIVVIPWKESLEKCLYLLYSKK